MRLSLGTAQFGLDYGVTNAHGQVPENAIAAILQTAKANGIAHIDTAAAYGTAETVLQTAGPLTDGFSITSKIPSLKGLTPPEAVSKIGACAAQSKQLLGANLQRLLFHDVSDLLGPEGLLYWQALEEAAAQQDISQIGVSVYTGEDISGVLGLCTPSAVQLPINIFDQRLLQDGSLEALKGRGVAIEARSVFLQGTLLSAAGALPGTLSALQQPLHDLRDAAQSNGLSTLDICLGFLRLTGLIDTAVVGVTTAEELEQICSAMQTPIAALPYQNFSQSDPMVLDPRYWPKIQMQRATS
ncbi:MAG: aldo/keto reductase [Pseudomonadota bacterium]